VLKCEHSYLKRDRKNIVVPADPRIGLVIGTHGCLAYIHLFLESAKRNFPHIPILISDDCSSQRVGLFNLCEQYGAHFFSNASRRGHFAGDVSSFVNGLEWAKKENLDLLVKMSRRFIPLYDWTKNFKELAVLTQSATYSNECKHYSFTFRSECVGMHVDSWYDEKESIVRIMHPKIFVEHEIHTIAKKIESKTNSNYKNSQLSRYFGYVKWDDIGVNRHVKNPNFLWHYYCSSKVYLDKSAEYGLNYTIHAFKVR